MRAIVVGFAFVLQYYGSSEDGFGDASVRYELSPFAKPVHTMAITTRYRWKIRNEKAPKRQHKHQRHL
jgi:hypothetical protein